MAGNVRVGDRVRLLGLPDWLTHDLPENEQIEMKEFVCQLASVHAIDDYGYVWIGFGTTIESNDSAQYSGHSFCVPPEFIEPA